MQSGKQNKTVFICNQCGFESRKWLGRCPDCGAWDSLNQSAAPLAALKTAAAEVQPLAGSSEEDNARLLTGMSELDRVLGGGIVPGSLVLIGGDPGIGKSTLLLQFMAAVAGSAGQVLYVTGEESIRQIRLRAQRLKVAEAAIAVSTETCVEAISALALKMQPVLLAVDSIQTMFSQEVASTPGSITQVRESAARLLVLAKNNNLPVFLVGHVTKDGSIAGPRVL